MRSRLLLLLPNANNVQIGDGECQTTCLVFEMMDSANFTVYPWQEIVLAQVVEVFFNSSNLGWEVYHFLLFHTTTLNNTVYTSKKNHVE